MKTGWQRSTSGNWYYFYPSGAMATGWQYIGSSYYYFYPTGDEYHWSGEMAANTWIGSYYVGSDGAWIPSYTGDSGSNSYAQSLQTLKSYIQANGFINSDGNKVINVTDYSDNGTQYVGAIVCNSSEDVLEFCAGSDGETAICVLQMSVSTIAGQNLYPEFAISFYESGNYYEAIATINASTYSRGDTVYFTVTDSNAYTSSQVQDLSNSFLTIGFQYWDVLVARAGLTLHDIGFTAY